MAMTRHVSRIFLAHHHPICSRFLSRFHSASSSFGLLSSTMNTPTWRACDRCTLCKPGSSAACNECCAALSPQAPDEGNLSAIAGAVFFPHRGSSREIALTASVVHEDSGSNQCEDTTAKKLYLW
jgi:hypothetical protein